MFLSDNLLCSQVTRAQFAILSPQVPHFWMFLRRQIIRQKTFLDTMQISGKEGDYGRKVAAKSDIDYHCTPFHVDLALSAT